MQTFKSDPVAIFEEIQDLRKYILSNNISLDTHSIVLFKKDDEIPTILPENVENAVENNVNVIIKNFFDSPNIVAELGDRNVIYVDEFSLNENIECDICILEKIDFLNRTLLTNICTENKKQYIQLDIEIDEKPYYNVSFELQEKSNSTLMTLDKKYYE